jgi:hypothetical protein
MWIVLVRRGSSLQVRCSRAPERLPPVATCVPPVTTLSHMAPTASSSALTSVAPRAVSETRPIPRHSPQEHDATAGTSSYPLHEPR